MTADLLAMLAGLVFSALVNAPVMLSTSLRRSFSLGPRLAYGFANFQPLGMKARKNFKKYINIKVS